MDRSTRRSAALVAAAVAVTFLLCRTAPLAARMQIGTSNWIKLGSTFINANEIRHVKPQGTALLLFFGDALPMQLNGPDAEAMRRWLEVRAEHPGMGEPPPSDPAPR